MITVEEVEKLAKQREKAIEWVYDIEDAMGVSVFDTHKDYEPIYKILNELQEPLRSFNKDVCSIQFSFCKSEDYDTDINRLRAILGSEVILFFKDCKSHFDKDYSYIIRDNIIDIFLNKDKFTVNNELKFKIPDSVIEIAAKAKTVNILNMGVSSDNISSIDRNTIYTIRLSSIADKILDNKHIIVRGFNMNIDTDAHNIAKYSTIYSKTTGEYKETLEGKERLQCNAKTHEEYQYEIFRSLNFAYKVYKDLMEYSRYIRCSADEKIAGLKAEIRETERLAGELLDKLWSKNKYKI